jgi:hypothetical protein
MSVLIANGVKIDALEEKKVLFARAPSSDGQENTHNRRYMQD